MNQDHGRIVIARRMCLLDRVVTYATAAPVRHETGTAVVVSVSNGSVAADLAYAANRAFAQLA